MSDATFMFFARPSFAEGVARVLDTGGALSEYNYSPTPQQADRLALEADWRALDHDWEQAFLWCIEECARRARHGKAEERPSAERLSTGSPRR